MKIIAIAFSLLSSLALAETAHKHEHTPAAVAKEASWQKVENKKVCMVTDMLFPREQIPITVDGKTYYGCCHNCKDRLGQDAAVRKAIDPISGKSVDKATASIAAGPDGSVQYFENDKNLETFAKKQK